MEDPFHVQCTFYVRLAVFKISKWKRLSWCAFSWLGYFWIDSEAVWVVVPCKQVKQLPAVQGVAFQGENGLLGLEDGSTIVHNFGCWSLKMVAVWSFKLFVTIYQPTGHNNPADMNLQQYHCDDLTSKIDLSQFIHPAVLRCL
jgi:hypothetical protein